MGSQGNGVFEAVEVHVNGRRAHRGYPHGTKAPSIWDVCYERTVSSGEGEALDFLFLGHRNGLYVADLGNPAKSYRIVHEIGFQAGRRVTKEALLPLGLFKTQLKAINSIWCCLQKY